MKTALIVCLVLAAITAADMMNQSDWSGGPGVLGPVPSWGSDFSCDTSVSWFETPGYLSLASGVEGFVEDGCTDFSVGDLDGDGDPDIAATRTTTNSIVWWENDHPSGRRWIEHTVPSTLPSPKAIAVADLDGDGDMDIIAGSATSSGIRWWQNSGTGGSWTQRNIETVYTGLDAVRAADIDGDGDMDLAGVSYTVNDVVWWKNAAGTGLSWARIDIDTNFSGAQGVAVADVDGDGVQDVLAAGSGAVKSVAWWDNTSGQGTSWTEHTVDLRYDGARGVAAADIDGDGDMDVIGAAQAADDITWWENLNGSGVGWTEHTIEGSFDGAYSVAAADIDGDGHTDVMGTAYSANDVVWWRNLDGSGQAWDANQLNLNLSQASVSACADIDGDGSKELLASGPGVALLWDLDDYQYDGALESSILDTQCDPDWGSAIWTATIPSGTYVTFRFRSSEDAGAMGDWSDTASSPCPLDGFVDDGDRFFQYRVRLQSSNPAISPVLGEFTLVWTNLGTGGGASPQAFELQPVSPNPSSGSVSVSFCTPEASAVEIAVYDIAGRLALTPVEGEFQPGSHTALMAGLRPGIYFVRMRAGVFEAAERFVVL